MEQFARFFIDFIVQFFIDFWNFLKNIFNAFANIFYFNIVKYFKMLGQKSPTFLLLDWILVVVMGVVIIAFFIFLFTKIYQLCRRSARIKRVEVQKEELLYEIADLKKQIEATNLEKQKIMELKLGNVTNNTFLQGDLVDESDLVAPVKEEVKETTEEDNFRFSKLMLVDKKYSIISTSIQMNPNDMVGLPQLVDRFINFAASRMHLYYTHKVISTYFAAMATSKIIILEGISGTGKTSLPYSMSHFFNNNASIVSVQPSWRDRAEIIGYLNEFTKKFNETDFLKSLYEVTYREDVNFIVLDEMNLARIEYYFAEFLSIMEMPDVSEWKIDLVPTAEPNDPKHLINGKLLVPQNVWFVGTANKDDSTFTITDKVYDRAVTIFLNSRANYIDAPVTDSINLSFDYLEHLYADAAKNYSISLQNLEALDKLDVFIQDNFKIAFGNRIMKQIKLFVPAYMACGRPELEGLDYMLCTKILKKFEALNIAFLKKEIDGLIALIQKLFGKDSFPDSIKYLKDLQKMN